eukprot:5571281-Pyramimonas_sp.AAC.1
MRTGQIVGSFLEDRNAGGVVTSLPSELCDCFDSIAPSTVVPGRVLLVHCRGPRGDLVVHNVRAPNTCDDVRIYHQYLRLINAALPAAAHTMVFILREWNFCTMEDGRFLVSGEVGPGDRLQCDAFQEHCGH